MGDLDPFALVIIVCVVCLTFVISLAAWNDHQGYIAWTTQLSAHGGSLICSDDGSQIIRFAR